MPSFQILVLGFLFVSFHPSRFRSHSRSTGAPLRFRLRAFPSHPLSFVRFRSVLTTQPSVLSFPCFPFSPDGGSSGASFLFRPTCFHAVLPIPVLSPLQFLSPPAVSPHSGYLSVSAFFLSVSGLFPLAFALGSGYSASGIYPLRIHPCPLRIYHVRSELLYTTTWLPICQLLFLFFRIFEKLFRICSLTSMFFGIRFVVIIACYCFQQFHRAFLCRVIGA